MTGALLTLVVALTPQEAVLSDALRQLVEAPPSGLEPLIVVDAGITADALPPLQGDMRRLTGAFATAAAAWSAGLAACETRAVSFVGGGSTVDPAALAALCAEIERRPLLAGLQAGRPAVPALPASWANAVDVGPDPLAELLAGRLDPTALAVDRDVLAAIGGLVGDAGEAVLFDLALRLALRGRLMRLEVAGCDGARPPPAGADAVLAQRIDEAGKGVVPRLPARRLAVLARDTRTGAWPRSAAATARQTANFAAARPVATVAAGPQALAALAAHLQASDAAFLAVRGGGSDPVAQILRLEADGLAACLAGVDDGLHHPPDTHPPLPGALFRRGALQRALRRAETQPGEFDEARFWIALMAAGPIDAARSGLPARRTDDAPAAAPEPADEVTAAERARLAALVDPAWYLEVYGDVAEAGVDPVAHFLEYGAVEGRSPQPSFRTERPLGPAFPSLRDAVAHYLRPDESDSGRRILTAGDIDRLRRAVDPVWYRAANPDLDDPQADPAEHFLTHGLFEGRLPNPWFRPDWYVADHDLGLATHRDALLHFVRDGADRGLAPHPDVDPAWYARRYLGRQQPDYECYLHLVANWRQPGIVPNRQLDHPLAAGFLAMQPVTARVEQTQRLAQRRLMDDLEAPARSVAVRDADGVAATAAMLVDEAYYLATNPDVAIAGLAAWRHYLDFGWNEGRDPNRVFGTSWYLGQNPDVAAAGVAPLTHYIRYGALEQRQPHPDFDPGWYARRYAVAARAMAPMLDYVLRGATLGRLPHPVFDHPAVIADLLRVGTADRPARPAHLLQARRAFEAGAAVYAAADRDLWRTVLCWLLPPRTRPVVVVAGDETGGITAPSLHLLPGHGQRRLALDAEARAGSLGFPDAAAADLADFLSLLDAVRDGALALQGA